MVNALTLDLLQVSPEKEDVAEEGKVIAMSPEGKPKRDLITIYDPNFEPATVAALYNQFNEDAQNIGKTSKYKKSRNCYKILALPPYFLRLTFDRSHQAFLDREERKAFASCGISYHIDGQNFLDITLCETFMRDHPTNDKALNRIGNFMLGWARDVTNSGKNFHCMMHIQRPKIEYGAEGLSSTNSRIVYTDPERDKSQSRDSVNRLRPLEFRVCKDVILSDDQLLNALVYDKVDDLETIVHCARRYNGKTPAHLRYRS